MSARLLPLRVLIKEHMVRWCALAGVQTIDFAPVRVTDLSGRRADQLREALRDTEERVRAVWERTQPSPGWDREATADLADRAMVTAGAATTYAAAATGDEGARWPGRYSDHRLIGRVDRILRMCITIAIITGAEGVAEAVQALEDYYEQPWTVADVAAYLTQVRGRPVAEGTVRGYYSRRALTGMPASLQDEGIAPRTGRPTWHPNDIRQWNTNRPGAGARTDLRKPSPTTPT